MLPFVFQRAISLPFITLPPHTPCHPMCSDQIILKTQTRSYTHTQATFISVHPHWRTCRNDPLPGYYRWSSLNGVMLHLILNSAKFIDCVFEPPFLWDQLTHSKTAVFHEIYAHWWQSQPVSLAFELSVMAHWPEGHLSFSPKLDTSTLQH